MTITSERDMFLRSFYAEARKADGTSLRYAKKSIVLIKYGIQKHFHNVRNDIDIVNYPEFVKLKKNGVGEHKQNLPSHQKIVGNCF